MSEITPEELDILNTIYDLPLNTNKDDFHNRLQAYLDGEIVYKLIKERRDVL